MTEASPPPILPIEFKAVSKQYRLGFWLSKKVQALKSLDLRVEQGQIFGLLGPNGAGKSTTIKILMNLVQASAGEVRLFGASPSDAKARRQVGYLPENPAPYDYLTGREFVTLGAQLAQFPAKEIKKRVDEVLDVVGMARTAGLQIRRYSKGMVQRVALAQALVGAPKLLVLDEPTSGLDPVGRRQMRDIILHERERGTTILFCTHIIPDIEALCDRVAVLVSGKLVQEGGVRELLTTKAPGVEIAIEGIGREALDALKVSPEAVHEIGGRLLVRVSGADSNALIGQIIAAGGRVTQLQQVRFSLEDLFMDVVNSAGYTASAGGEIVG
ncbi:MAG: ABC transporter ATP-binding protein [Myxococcaceae bacterium]|nr:ABC transporter ATP-binding protein [Myxococcaceae bacterium]